MRHIGHDGRVEWAQAATIISAMAVFTGVQAFWISRALDRVEGRMDRLEGRMDRLEGRIHDLVERIARLETARSA
jgi:hypothetical protein